MDLCPGDRGWSDWRTSLCIVDWVNVGVGLCSVYITSVVTGYLKWEQDKGKESSTVRILPWHNCRGLLSILLLVLHFLELADAFLTFPPPHVLAVCTASFAFWANSLLLAHIIESAQSPNYLLLSSTLWTLNACVRILRFIALLVAGVSLQCLRPLTALLVASLAVGLAALEFCSWFKQRSERTSQDVPLTTTSRYKHDTSHFLSKATFHWLTPLLRTGYSCPLEMEDLGVLPEHHRGKAQLQIFEEYYSKFKSKPLAFWKSCWMFIRDDFVAGGVWKLLGDSFSLVGPLGISIIVDFIAEQKIHVNSNRIATAFPTLIHFWRNGWTMSAVVLFASIAQSICSQTSTHLVNVKAIQLNAALQAKIYTKSLKLSKFKEENEKAKPGKDETGTTAHLLSEDTFNIMSAFWVGHYIWAIPLKISLLLFLLYSYMGASALIGSLLTIFLLIPLQLFIGKSMSSNATSLSDITDVRLQQVSSLVGNAKLLKMLAWENVFADKIHKTRKEEEAKLNKDSTYWASMTFLTHIASILAVIFTLVTHRWIDGSALTPDKVFTVLALFNQLTVPLFIFPVTVPLFIGAVVSGKRLAEFFAQPEIEKSMPKLEKVVKSPFSVHKEEFGCEGSIADFGGLWNSEIRDKCLEAEEIQGIEVDDDDGIKGTLEDSEETALKIDKALFRWGNNSKGLTLQVDNVTIPKGKLTMIIGKVGCGKTCFLSALLGEMEILQGDLQWRRNTIVAYASQSPWLLNGTVRDNITFGRPFRAGRYAQVIAACALGPDLEILPEKDLTEIGEKGIQLSGGQKQRIGVARALYSRANFVILDDPLSSLDHTLAVHVFEAGIKRLVRRNKRTVLLVVHHLALLKHSHNVIVMENGCVRVQGQFTDLETLDKATWQDGIDTSEDEDQTQGRTARERWQLVKLVASIGLELKQRLLDPSWQSEEEISEMPLKRKSMRHRYPPLSEWSFLSHDLPLQTEECGVVRPAWRQSYSKRRTMMTRANSLQTRPIRTTPVTRQFSTPMVRRDNSRGSSQSLLRRLLRNKPPVNNPPKKHQPLQRLSSTESGFSDASSEADPDEFEDGEISASANASEEREYGRIPRKVCETYIKSCGVILTVLYFGVTLAWQAIKVLTDTWLTTWTESTENHDTFHFLLIYSCLSALAVVLSLGSHGVGQWASARARVVLHKDLLSHITKCQMSVFETTPAGRFVNRFSTDIGVIDKKLGPAIQRLVQFLLLCLSALLVNAAVTPWFLIIAVPICLLYFAVQRFYRTSSRELQRLDSISRSPVLSHFLETQTGLSTIRAYCLEEKFTSVFLAKLDQHTNAFLILNSSNRWLGIVLDCLGGVIVYVAIVTALLSTSFTSPSLVGLAINYTLLVPIYLNWVVKFLAECEMYMGAVERISQCLRLPVENAAKDPIKVPEDWPTKGAIKFVQVTLRYSLTREPVFTSLNLCIPPGQTLGICGRSGSGKSTLVLSLFRLLEASTGRITIDGVNIAAVALPLLRSKVAVVPQEASLLSGTVRGNLDPETKCSDEELWAALDAVKLRGAVETMFNGLDGEIREGEMLSNGQRQLFCLARAVLQRAAILVMDEATSSLDSEAEQLLMVAAKEAFSGKTLIIIAHRLSTLTDCDRILVVDRGRIVEDGSPEQLLSKQMGLFSTMLRAAENTNI